MSELTRAKLKTPLSKFALAGRSTFTVVSVQTGTRFTYKVKQLVEQDDNGKDVLKPMWFVSVLTGPDNEDDYRYIGVIDSNGFRTTKGTKISLESPSIKAFVWLWRNADNLDGKAELWHEGRCGRCNRKLTVPTSIESGFGPECIQHIEM